ncbi:MAG: hypothetical protein V4494_06065 [Chlamydiota bacterium]
MSIEPKMSFKHYLDRFHVKPLAEPQGRRFSSTATSRHLQETYSPHENM